MFRRILITGFAFAALLGADQDSIHREGDFWVETSHGSEAFSGNAGSALEQVQIASVGNITVRGANGSRIGYTVTRRMRTRDEATAREAFEEGGLSVQRQGRNMRIVVSSPNGPVDVQVAVPRGAARLVIVTEMGAVDVDDFFGSVSVRSGGGPIKLNRIKGVTEVQSDGSKLDIGDLAGPLRALLAAGDIVGQSIGGAAQLETAGNVDVGRIGGAARVVTEGGRVHIGETGGTVSVNSAGGAIDVGRAGGVISVSNSGGGPIQIGSAPFGVDCANGSGAIRALGIDGAVHLATMAGSLIAQLQSKLLSDSSLTTGSGDITVLIPSNVGVTIQAQDAGAGRVGGIVSDFPAIRVRLSGLTAFAQGSVNGGGPVLHLTANGGLISIKKK